MHHILDKVVCLVLLIASCLSARASEPTSAESFHWDVVESAGIARRVFPSPVDSETVFVWSTDHFNVSKDRGRSFKALPVSAGIQNVTSLLVDPTNPVNLYIGTAEHGVFISGDDGNSWHAAGGKEAGLAHPHIHSLLFSSHDASFKTIYALHSTAKAGISMSSDGGRSWKTLIKDYGIDGMVLVQSAIFFAGAHPAGGDEIGFFRIDPTRGSFRVCVDTPTALNEGLFNSRIWLGTAEAGIKFSDDFGVTKADAGPAGINVVSMAAGYTSAFSEAEYVYDPHTEGVLMSADGFKTWKKINNGLYVGEWVTDGACMDVSADGAVLFACVNDKLYRGTASETKLIKHLGAQPTAVAIGEGPVTFTCIAPKGVKLEMDLSPIGGAANAAMTEESAAGESATYTLRMPEIPSSILTQKDRRGAPLPGRVPLSVKAIAGSQTESRLALLTVLKPAPDLMLWNGESHNVLSTWSSGIGVRACREQPLSGDTHLRFQVRGAGLAGASWKQSWGNYDGDDLRYHKLLTFCIRSDIEAPTDLKLALRDDGRRLGHGEGSRSNEVQLSNYIQSVGPQYRFVTIPLSDLLFGSAAAPEGIAELMFIAPSGSPVRTYDVDDIAALARPHLFLSNSKVALTADGQSVEIQAFAASAAGAIQSVCVYDGDRKFDLLDDGRHQDRAAGDGIFGATIPVSQMPPGTHTLRLAATDAGGTVESRVETFVPRKTFSAISKATADFKLDLKMSEFANAKPFQIEDPNISLSARLLYGNGKLYVALQVKDPAFDGKELAKPETAEKLSEGPSVELWITSPTHFTDRSAGNADHHFVFAFGGKKAVVLHDKSVIPALGEKTEKGYSIVTQIPFAALQAGKEPCDIAFGKSTRIEWRMRSAAGKRAAWAAPDANAPANRENWGLAHFGEESGSPRLSYVELIDRTVTIVSNKRLKREVAENPASYSISGVNIEKAVLSADGRTLKLTASAPWSPAPTTITFSGLAGDDGSAPPEPLSFVANPGRPASGNFIPAFLLSKPIMNIDPMSMKEPLTDEKVKPAQGGDWTYVEGENGINLGDTVGALNNCAVAAHVYVYSDADRNAQLWFGSDDGIRAVLNGQAVHVNAVMRGCVPDQDRVKVKLNKGWNTLMLTISQLGGGWGFTARIMDENGAAPKGISTTAERPAALAAVGAP